MLDFRRKSPRATHNYLGQSQQLRLLSLVMLAGLIMVLIGQAGQPAKWWWLFQQDQPQENPNDAPAAEPQTRLRAAPLSADLADSFSAPRSPNAGSQESPSSSAAASSSREEESQAFFPGLQSDELKAVRDDTVLRGAEHDVWFHLLELLEHSDEATLDASSTGEVSYVQLFKQPDAYRGRLVSVRGVVRGVREIAAAKNEQGIDHYYQLSLEPAGGPARAIIIYALHLPASFPVGMNVAANCNVTGFFYKRWAYQAQDGIHTAPLILSRGVTWLPQAEPDRTATTDLSAMIWVVAGALVLAVCVVTVLWNRSRRQSLAEMRLHASRPPVNLDAALREADVATDPGEVLRKLDTQAKA